MSGKYLLDTNIVIALFADEPILTDKIAKAEDISVPVVVIGELFYGASRSGRKEYEMHPLPGKYEKRNSSITY